eukprot:scaffold86735_cov54-Phaeocystis_antarctica.AAC.3
MHRDALALRPPLRHEPPRLVVDGTPCRMAAVNDAEVYCHLGACGLRRRRGEAHAQLPVSHRLEQWRRRRRWCPWAENSHSVAR